MSAAFKELTVYTRADTTHLPHPKGPRSLRILDIIALASPGVPLLRKGGYPMDSRAMTTLRLRPDTNRRVYEFMRHALSGQLHEFDGYSFANYVSGHTKRMDVTGRPALAATQVAAGNRLKPGDAYAIASRRGFVGAVVGVEEPQLNMGVLGLRGPIAISKNNDLLKAADGQCFSHY